MNIETATSRDILEEFLGKVHELHTMDKCDISPQKIVIHCTCGAKLPIGSFEVEISAPSFGGALTLKDVSARLRKLGKDSVMPVVGTAAKK